MVELHPILFLTNKKTLYKHLYYKNKTLLSLKYHSAFLWEVKIGMELYSIEPKELQFEDLPREIFSEALRKARQFIKLIQIIKRKKIEELPPKIKEIITDFLTKYETNLPISIIPHYEIGDYYSHYFSPENTFTLTPNDGKKFQILGEEKLKEKKLYCEDTFFIQGIEYLEKLLSTDFQKLDSSNLESDFKIIDNYLEEI